MKRVALKIVASLLVGASFCATTLPVSGDIVYNNSTNKLNQYYDPGVDSGGNGIQFGDQVILDSGSTSRRLTAFTFEYFLPIASGNESIRLRFYGPSSDDSLGVKLFDSGFEHVGATTLNDGLTLKYTVGSYASMDIILPDTFTWTVQFDGIDQGETAGLELYSAPTVGNNFTDFWQLNPDTQQWERRLGPNGTPMDFGAVVEAVPEASPLQIGLLTLVVWVGVRGLRRKLAKA